MKWANNRELAEDYCNFVTSEKGQSFFKEAGFIPAFSEEGERLMAEMNKLKQVYVEANFKEIIANWTPDSKPTGDYLPRIAEQIELLRESLVATEE